MAAATDEWVKRVLNIDIASVQVGAVNYGKCRLAWTTAKQSADTQLKELQRVILDRYKDEPFIGEISKKIHKFDDALALFADNLGDVLDQAYSAPDPDRRRSLHKQAAGMIATMLTRAEGDPFIAKLESNPYMPFTARAVLIKTLGALSRQIA